MSMLCGIADEKLVQWQLCGGQEKAGMDIISQSQVHAVARAMSQALREQAQVAESKKRSAGQQASMWH